MEVGPWIKNQPTEIALTPRTKELWEKNALARLLLDAEPIFIYKLKVRDFLRRTS